MGTRRHQLDYTSSSDQSCDTVIYVGSDGCPISDHELTDYERPPTASSAQDGGGNGSLARVRGKPATFKCSLPRAVGGRHSDGELATSGRHLRSMKPSWRSPPPPPPLQRSAKKCGEMWIDGPKSMMTCVEQWVDGPPEFRHADDIHHVDAVSQPAEIAHCDSSIVEVTERHSLVEASTALTDDFHVKTKLDGKKREETVLQSHPLDEQFDVNDSNCITKVGDLQFTVVDVHQSAERNIDLTEVSSVTELHARPDLENQGTSEDSVEMLSVERRTGFTRTKLDIDALLLANRESIYELQMDEELERGSRESLLQLVCGSDDDWSTCGTEPRRSKCCESQSFRDLDDCLKDLDDMVVTTSEQTELKTQNEVESSIAGQQKNEESAKIIVDNDVPQKHVLIRTREDNKTATSCVESECTDRNITDMPTIHSFKIEPDTVTTPTISKTRKSALPVPMSSSPSRVRRKPPPIPVRSSSVSLAADRSTNGPTKVTNIADTSSPQKTCFDVIQQKTLTDSKNGLASGGCCSGDCSAAGEDEVTTGIAAAATTNTQHGNSAVTETTVAVDAKQSASIPLPATKTRSRIALPCRREKKNKPQPEMSASSSTSPSSRSTMSTFIPKSECVSTASREMPTATTLLSPYHSVTKSRACRGAGSNNSSSVRSSERAASVSRLQTGARRRGGSARGTRSEVEASSGYESMIRDSEEVTGASSASECQSPFRLKANKIFRKKGLFIGIRYRHLLICVLEFVTLGLNKS